MLWTKAFHIIFMVTWFAGLFYLPRLYVYHADTTDGPSRARFQTMERRLYYMIMTPGAILTLLSGAWLVHYSPSAYLTSGWLQLKILLVFFLVLYHLYLGRLRAGFCSDQGRKHTSRFYRWINEIPTVFLIVIVILAVTKPL